MKIHLLLLLLCLVACLAAAQDAKQATLDKYGPTVEITAEPSHHLKIENAYIRAFYIDVAPHQSTLGIFT